MANIMLIDACNLQCPYCFANEFVNRDRNEISDESFYQISEFILSGRKNQRVGIIGGEPMLHSNFDFLISELASDNRVSEIVVFTNGTKLHEHSDICCHPKVRLLINCNSPADIGQSQYDRMCKNIETLIVQKHIQDHMTLGINMYQPDFEYAYLLRLLLKYDFHCVRTSITVPNMDSGRNTDPHEYFRSMKPSVMKFFRILLSNDIVPFYDCNKLIPCLITEEEQNELQYHLDRISKKGIRVKTNILGGCVSCDPVIDIRQDLTAVRCFGLSEWTKQSIADYSSLEELQNHYNMHVDIFKHAVVNSASCIDCSHRKNFTCTGGCLTFKAKRLLDVDVFVVERNLQP